MKRLFDYLTLLFCILAINPGVAQADTLAEIYRLALEHDHKFKAAQASAAAGKEEVNIGLSGLLPQIDGTASYSESDTDQDGETFNFSSNDIDSLNQSSNRDATTYSVTLGQPIVNFAAWFNYKRGKLVSKQAEADFITAQRALIIRVAEAYFDALEAVDNLATAVAEETALKRQLDQTRQRFEVGLTAITEVHESQAAFDSAVANRLSAAGNLGITFEALEVITGHSHTQLSPLKDNFPVNNPEPAERHKWVKFAIENNSALKSAYLLAQASRQNAKAKTSDHLPTLSGAIEYSEVNADGDNGQLGFFDTTEESTSIALTLNVPIFSGGRTSASRRQAHQQYLEAKENHHQTQRDTIQNTRSIHLSVETGVASVKARKQAITSNQSALEATQAGYDVGTRDLVDVLNAQRNLYSAQRDYFTALYDYILSTLRLKEVAGILSPKDVEELNQWLDRTRPVSRKR